MPKQGHGSLLLTEMPAAQRENLLASMRFAANDFYRNAVATGHRPFVEFAGLMQKFIEQCARAHQAGRDFTTASSLPLEAHDGAYLGEKLQCIYGPSISKCAPARQALVFGLLGIDASALDEDDGAWSEEEMAEFDKATGPEDLEPPSRQAKASKGRR